jgi:hypothetical protein
MFLWWVGSRITAPTPNLGDQDFLSVLSPLAFGVPTPFLQGNKICNPRRALTGCYQPEPAEPWFCFRGYSSPSSFLNWAWDWLWRSCLKIKWCQNTDSFLGFVMTVSDAKLTVYSKMMWMKGKLITIWKGTVMHYLKVLSQHSDE